MCRSKDDLQLLKKSVKISDILGIVPPKNEFFIKSPFRNEKTPSFKINHEKNVWYDFGVGRGGSNVDLIVLLKKCTAKEAIEFLRSFNLNTSFSFSPVTNITLEQREKKVIIVKNDELKNPALIDYLKSRKIDIDIAKNYVRDIYFRVDEKNYFGIGFKNDSNGYEIRNKYAKMCILKKDITIIDNPQNDSEVTIFEGFIDFLSALTFFKTVRSKTSVIVLNSLSLLNKIDLSKYEKINLFLDNDHAGEIATKRIVSKHKNVVDFSKIYEKYKDFNDFLIAR